MEPMAGDAGEAVTGGVLEGGGGSEKTAPGTFGRPADASPPLGRASDLPALATLRHLRADEAPGGAPGRSPAGRLRAWVGRVSGRADRRLLHVLADATEVLAAHCDAMTDRLNASEDVRADTTKVFGEELTALRAEAAHLRTLAQAPPSPPPPPV